MFCWAEGSKERRRHERGPRLSHEAGVVVAAADHAHAGRTDVVRSRLDGIRHLPGTSG